MLFGINFRIPQISFLAEFNTTDILVFCFTGNHRLFFFMYNFVIIIDTTTIYDDTYTDIGHQLQASLN